MIIETQYFPCIYFWAKALETKRITLESHENYQKRSYRNKCEILSANHKLTLSVPLIKGKNNGQAIKDVKISYVDAWQANQINSVKSSYGSAPYFEFYWEDIKRLISKKETFLYDYNLNVLQYFSKIFGIEILETEEYIREYTKNDFRQKITPKTPYTFLKTYDQVFAETQDFVPNLSILDLLFCLGPESIIYLQNIQKNIPSD